MKKERITRIEDYEPLVGVETIERIMKKAKTLFREGFGLTVAEAMWKGIPGHWRKCGRHPLSDRRWGEWLSRFFR